MDNNAEFGIDVPESEIKKPRPKIAVAGSTGIIGNALDKYNIDADVIGLKRSGPPGPDILPGIDTGLDLFDLESIRGYAEALQQNRVRTLINLTNSGKNMDVIETERGDQDGKAYKLHVQGAENLAKALAERNIGLIHVSTDAALWTQNEIPGRNEEIDPRMVDPEQISTWYGQTKLLGEQRVLEAHPEAIIVRLGQVNSQNDGIMPLVLRHLASGESLSVRDDQQISPLTDKTVAESLLKIAKQLPEGLTSNVLHLAARDTASPYDIGQRLAQITGGNSDVIRRATYEDLQKAGTQRVKRPLNTNLSVARFEEAFGGLPTVMEEANRFNALYGNRITGRKI